MEEWLDSSSDIHQVSVAAQRLSVIDQIAVKDIIRRRVDDEARPMVQRIFALALLVAGDERSMVSRVMSQHPANIASKKWLEDVSFGKPSIPGDYDWSS